MYLLDKKQRVRRWLKDNDFIEAEMTEEINAANQINFSTPLKDRIADNIYYVAIPTPRSKQKYLLFKLLSERVQNDRIEYQGIEEAYDELKQYGYIKDIRPNDRTAEEMLKMVLEPTRWTLGNVTETSHQSTNLYYITYLEALQKIVGLFNIELTFEVTIDPKSNKITRRQVNIYTEQGQRTGKRFEYGSNLLTVQQEQDSQELITALVGRGKGELVSEGHDDTPDGYGRRITFADVVWTKKDGNPVDKPAGQEYLIDPEATALYGFSDGNPRIGLTVFEDIEDPVELINATWRALQSLKRPKVSFKADVTDVGQLGLGDTVAIIRHDLKIEYFTRVYKVKHNLLNENDNQIELGDDFSGHSITSSLIKVDEIANEARETAGYAAIAANGKNNNYYSSVQPLAPVEGDIWYKDLGNGETDMYQYHNGGWVFIQSTRDLHVVENQVKEAQQGLDQAKADIINNKQKADADIENLNKSIEANKKTADESLQKLNDSVANLQGQYDNNIVPNLNQVTADVADALQKYTTAQQNIADLTKQAQQQGKDIADVSNTVKGLNINYANLAGDVNSTKVDVKGLQTTIGTANGDIAQLKLDAQNLQTMLAGKVDNTTYTNFVNLTNQALNARLTASDLNGYAKTVDVQATANGLRVDLNSVTQDIQNDLSQLSARIATTSQQFSSYYTKSETDNKTNSAKNDAVNAIKSDGNWQGLSNILTNSGFLQTADGFLQKVQQTTVPMFNGGGINLATKTGNVSLSGGYNSSENIGYISLDAINDLCGKYMTVSVDVEWSGWKSGNQNRLGYQLQINYDDGSTEYDGCWLTPTTANGKQRVTATYKIKDQHVKSLGEGNAYIQINCTSAKVSRLKLEQGSVATPWTPNPADLATQSAFSELSQSLEGLRSTVGSNYGSLQSQIDQTAKNIRQEVSDKTSGLQTQITQQANSFNVSLNALRNETAWQKVTTAIDANNYTTTGNYWIQAVSNSNTPDGSAWAYLEVVAEPAVERIKQTWQRDNNANEAYTRLKTGNTWSDWQKTVTAGNIMAQINMSAGTTLIQNNKIYMDADSTIFSGKAFIPSAAISNLSADKITTGTLNAGLINVINLNASSITTGTINGANLKIDLNNGEVQFKRGRITSIANTLNINIDTGTMSVTDGVNNGVYFANGELKLMDDPLNITGTPKYGGLRRSAHIWSPGSAGAELHSPNGVFVGSDNYNGAFAGGSGIDGTSSGAALAVDKDGSATLNGANIVSVSGGSAYDVGYSMKNRPAIILGKSQSGWNPGDRTFIQGAFVHIESAYRNTNGASPNVYVAPDGALVRSTSASKYKTDIQRSYVSDYGERLLELPTATWMDKAETERYVDGESQDKPVRHFGMIAEDLADAGLEMLVSRGQDGELEGIQYDRIGPALIPVIKQLQDKVNKLEEKLNER
ncbi:phage tail protein [Limosilactobacillus fermentum]|nr:phage tail spike protein [Limosilactobacillus fermentum]MCH5394998.1 phage tail protein [Limosilactobacillus fermentum]